MKNFKRIASAVAALALAATMAVPMSAMLTATAATGSNNITINKGDDSNSDAIHAYVAYQVFSGTLNTDKTKFESIDWGDGVNKESILSAVQGITITGDTKPFENCLNAQAVADVLSGLSDGDEALTKFIDAVVANLGEKSGTGGPNGITGVADGYYLVMDESEPTEEGSATPNSSAMTRYILKVVGASVEVDAKVAAPTVDKKVWDNDDTTYGTGSENNNDWGDTADHTFGKTFQFKLTATLPTSTEIDKYEEYYLKFTDNLTIGVAFDNNTVICVTAGGQKKYFAATATGDESGDDTDNLAAWSGVTIAGSSDGNTAATITFEIADLYDLLPDGVNSISGAVVDVIYDAHLTEKATTNKTSNTSTPNANEVDLEYSNNPNATGEGSGDDSTGKTPKKKVWVFAYELDITKKGVGNDVDGLDDATFELTDAAGNPINVTWDDTNKIYYVDANSSSNVITSKDGGKMSIRGLDAGKYNLTEKSAPAGYVVPTTPVVFEITAKHTLSPTPNNVELTFEKDDEAGTSFTIQNTKSTSLPGTGGIGTTLFYVIGGTLVVGAGVTLITKKRMQKD